MRFISKLLFSSPAGTALVLPKKHYSRPLSLEGLRETVADLYLLSRTTLLVGTPNSEFTEVAAAAGNTFLVLVDGAAAAQGQLPSVREKLTNTAMNAGVQSTNG